MFYLKYRSAVEFFGHLVWSYFFSKLFSVRLLIDNPDLQLYSYRLFDGDQHSLHRNLAIKATQTNITYIDKFDTMFSPSSRPQISKAHTLQP